MLTSADMRLEVKMFKADQFLTSLPSSPATLPRLWGEQDLFLLGDSEPGCCEILLKVLWDVVQT